MRKETERIQEILEMYCLDLKYLGVLNYNIINNIVDAFVGISNVFFKYEDIIHIKVITYFQFSD